MERVGENEAAEAPPFIPKDGYGASGKMQGASSTPMLQVTRRKDQALPACDVLQYEYHEVVLAGYLIVRRVVRAFIRVEHLCILLGEEHRQPPALPTHAL